MAISRVRIPKNVAAYYEEGMAISRSQDTEERKYFLLRDDALRHAARRSAETPRRRSARLQADHPSLTNLIAQ